MMAIASPPRREALAGRVAAVRSRIDAARVEAGRPAGSVRLVAVTKTHPAALAQAAVDVGLHDLGESRVQELTAKRDQVQGARWHLVGRLQTNKARAVVGQDILVHSLDRHALADALSRRAARAGVVQRVLIQVNVGDDPGKGGCDVHEALDLVAYAVRSPNLAVEGLMTMPPLPPPGADPGAAARPCFARLRSLRDEARSRWPDVAQLSMGMSADLEAAVAEGATMVRVGTALFGPRQDGRGGDPAGRNR